MEITEIRVKLTEDRNERLKAYCSLTLDGQFVIRDLKIIEGAVGHFVAMPSRKLADRCPRCGGKNHLRARFCNECGARLDPDRAPKDDMGRSKLHADIAHPINAVCRDTMQARILQAFEEEKVKAARPGYRPPSLYDDTDIDHIEDLSRRVPPLRRTDEDRPAPRGNGHVEAHPFESAGSDRSPPARPALERPA